jgi:hypothetical protein
MSFSVLWHIEKKVIHLKVFGTVTPEEVFSLNQKTMALLEVGNHPVHIIVDTLEVTAYPTNLRWVMRMLQTNPVRPSGRIILVQNNSAVRVLASAILGILRYPLQMCTTLEEATDLLESTVYTSIS